MIKTSLIMPVYNEIRFIKRTLENVVGEADQIIISDNASTDGTSEICQEFAQKHTEIEYYRHSENTGSASFIFSLDKAKGEYIMPIGGHDMISKNRIKHLSQILDNNKDAVLAFSKIVHLDEMYSFIRVNFAMEFNHDLMSTSPFVRVSSIVNHLGDCFQWYGLHRSNTLKAVINEHVIFDKLFSEMVLLSNLASKGKLILDTNSTFYAIQNKKAPENCSFEQNSIRVIKAQRNLDSSSIVENPYELLLAVICGTYEVAKKMLSFPDAPKDFDKKILNDLLKRYIEFNLTSKGTTIIPGKEKLIEEVLLAINQYNEAGNTSLNIVNNKVCNHKELENEYIQKQINTLISKYKDQKVLLYGAGKFAELLLDNYHLSKLNIIGISDSKYSYVKQDFKNFKAYAPEEIQDLNPDVIIITILEAKEIIKFFEIYHPEILTIPINIIDLYPKIESVELK